MLILIFYPIFLTTFSNSVIAQNNTNQSSLSSDDFGSFLKSLLSKKSLESLQKDITGHYNNTDFGINDIVFPKDWHGKALPVPFGLMITMRPNNLNEQDESLGDLFNQTKVHPIEPVISLQVLNNSQLSKFLPSENSIPKNCKQLSTNSTLIINGKTFNVMSIECPFSSLFSDASSTIENNNQQIISQMNNPSISNETHSSQSDVLSNTNGVGQSKVYEYKTPINTYRLILSVSNSIFSPSTEKPDIHKYTPILDDIVKTLKIN